MKGVRSRGPFHEDIFRFRRVGESLKLAWCFSFELPDEGSSFSWTVS